MYLTRLRPPISAAARVTALTVRADVSKVHADAKRRTANVAAAHPSIADNADTGPGRQSLAGARRCLDRADPTDCRCGSGRITCKPKTSGLRREQEMAFACSNARHIWWLWSIPFCNARFFNSKKKTGTRIRT